MAVTLFGVLYVGWLSAHLVLLRELPWRAGTAYADGAAFVLLAFFLTWSCDTAAYAVGRTLGRTRPWTRISQRKSVEGAVGGLLAAVVAAFVARAWFAPFLGVRDAVVLGLGLRRPDLKGRIEGMAVTLFGVLYVGWLSAHLVLLRELPWRAGTPYADGAAFVLLAFFLTWSCDTAAYAVGRAFGRTRPWTRISPRKSVEGAVGGLLAAGVAGFVARAWFAPFLSLRDAAVLGLGVGVFAQVGDLVESMLKRDARHGDSSDFIPGHGGILDRFDSLYFAAPLVFYYLKIVVFRIP
jgi:CDP-diglyceride synthetase